MSLKAAAPVTDETEISSEVVTPPADWKAVAVRRCFVCLKDALDVDAHSCCAKCAWLCGCYHCLNCGKELPAGGGLTVNGRSAFCMIECGEDYP